MSTGGKKISEFSEWMIRKLEEMESLSNQTDESQVSNFIMSILDYASVLENTKEIGKCLSIIKATELHLGKPITHYIKETNLQGYGISRYSEKKNLVAEWIFKYLAERGSLDAKNNLAYMIRRKETISENQYKPQDVLRMLEIGIILRNPFCYVNIALTLSLCLGKDEDWILADDLMMNLPQNMIESVADWWLTVAQQGDIEGVLVHYFMLRHGKIRRSELGTMETMQEQLNSSINNFPEWMKTHN